MADRELRDISDPGAPTKAQSPTAETEPVESATGTKPPTRRALIASIAGLVGATLAKALVKPGEADAQAACEPVAADCLNVVTGTTQLDRSGGPGVPATTAPVLQVSTAEYTAVHGSSLQGVAVVGRSGAVSGFGVATGTLTIAGGAFFSDSGAGAVGVSTPTEYGDAAIEASLAAPAGLLGLAATRAAGVIGITHGATVTISYPGLDRAAGGIGVLGLQGEAMSILGPTHTLVPNLGGGVFGLSRQGIGVFGGSSAATASGVLAFNVAGGPALQVDGPAIFSTIGEGLIAPQVLEHDVQDARVDENSHIMVTFNSPAKKLFVSWVEIVAGFGFRLHLSKKQKTPVSFTYLVLQRASNDGAA